MVWASHTHTGRVRVCVCVMPFSSLAGNELISNRIHTDNGWVYESFPHRFFLLLHRRTLSDNFNYLFDGIWWVAERTSKWKENVCHYSICPKRVEKSMQCDGFKFLIKLACDRFYHNSISMRMRWKEHLFRGNFWRITSESETRNSRNKNRSTIFFCCRNESQKFR